MSRHAELAHAGAADPDADIKVAPPLRGKRLALWVAWASASLAAGVMGIVASGDRFDYDKLLAIIGSTTPTQHTSWSGDVAPLSSPPARSPAIASAELAPAVSSAPADHGAGSHPDSAAAQPVARVPGQASHAATQNHRHPASHVGAIARHAPRITRPTSPTQQASSSDHVVRSPSPSVQGTAIGSATGSPPVASASLDHRDAPSAKSASLQLAQGQTSGGHSGGGSGAGGPGAGAGGTGAGGAGVGGAGVGGAGVGGAGAGGAGAAGAGAAGAGAGGAGAGGAGAGGAGAAGAGAAGAG
ncbi:conserved hypothetical protein, partial [Ricinus communis]